MRRQFIKTLEDILGKDERLVLLLGDIGVFGFRNSLKKFPNRVYNIGILEQSTLGLAAGLSMQGLIPVVHTIAPFIVERALEQIKNDFGFQRLRGNLVSVGGSYDYAALGCTHHCPGDIGILMNVPEIQIVVPGSAYEFDDLFRQAYANGKLTYFRLSERSNQNKIPVKFGKAKLIKRGKSATVIAIGPMLERVLNITKDFDVTVIYLTTIRPLDTSSLKRNICGNKVIICEPYYGGSIIDQIISVVKRPLRFDIISVPRKFIDKYGTTEDHDERFGFTEKKMFNRIKKFINE